MNLTRENIIIELQQDPKLLERLVKYAERLEILKQRSKEYANTEEGREYYRQKAANYYEKNRDLILQKAKEKYEKNKVANHKVVKILTQEELLVKRQKNLESQKRRREKLRQEKNEIQTV